MPTKKVSGRTHHSGDFLVVEDTAKTSTWHLPVKVNGTPNRRLAGAAWAALFSEKGFRGNKYDGPDKTSAKRKLKALYKAQEWDEPTAELFAELEEDETIEGYTDCRGVYRDFGSTTFDQLKTAEAADEKADAIKILTEQFKNLISNIMRNDEISEKGNAIKSLSNEFVALIDQELSNQEVGEIEEIEFAESSIGGAVIGVTKEMDLTEAGEREPLMIDAVLIKPGFGNKKDNHYYPKKMLKEYSHVFEGVKMYTTDHKADEKSVRTEVSVVDRIKGFTDDGAPIARVTIFDPSFAEATRNRIKSNKLETLECSILATGKARKGRVNGKEAKIVEAITTAKSVDWVTRAGAGGHAISKISESENENSEVTNMPKELTLNIVGDGLIKEIDPTNLREALEKLMGEDATVESVSLAESDDEEDKMPLSESEIDELLEKSDLPDPAKTKLKEGEYESVEDLEKVVDQEFEYLKSVATESNKDDDVTISEADVGKVVDASNLPDPAKAKIKEGEYETADDLESAITKEVEYLKSVTSSGKPVGRKKKITRKSSTVTEDEIREKQAAVLTKWQFNQRPVKKEEA